MALDKNDLWAVLNKKSLSHSGLQNKMVAHAKNRNKLWTRSYPHPLDSVLINLLTYLINLI